MLPRKYKTDGDVKDCLSYLKDCLSNLYNILLKNEVIDKETDEDLFIYRFSGIGTPKDLENVIKWKGTNVLLGHIARCLLSDDKQGPMGLGKVSTFFKSKTGKKMNLSTKDTFTNDYEGKKTDLNRTFVTAVELLQGSGFRNAEVTSKRR